MFGGSSSRSQQSYGSSQIVQMNDSVYQLYKPAGTSSIQIVFFHGLQWGPYTDAHLTTWKCQDESCIWPQSWIPEEIPEAHVFSVSCNGILRNSSNARIDFTILGENLISDLLMANIGQVSNCPIVLVGHSIGGLVIKELCCQAHQKLKVSRDFERAKLEKFLKSMRGVFYYATPHHGSPVAERLAEKIGDGVLKYFETLSTDTARLNSTFDGVRKVYENWKFAGLGEGCPTSLGWFDGEVMVVPEASVREDNFNVVEGANHFSICRPRSKTSRSFYKLKDFLVHIVDEMKVAVPIHECNGLPKYPIDLERRALDVREKLIGGATLGIFGMGGIGKTTLAKQTFNLISKDFEYTCFVDNVKGIQAHRLEDWLLNHFHRGGEKLDAAQTSWFHMKDKKSLIVVDDIDSEDQLKVLPQLQHFGTGTCIIMTSRDKEVFKFYEDCITYEVDFLEEADAKKLFCRHAFGLKDVPSILIDNVNAVVKKCAGLPLTLEVIGTYLQGHGRGSGIDIKVWTETINRLGKAQTTSGGKNDRVWASLKVSYDGLSEEEQEMFVEAALIFFKQPLDPALAAWSTISENMHTAWKNLVSRSLVKEVSIKVLKTWPVYKEYKVVWVHEQLRDLARNIAGGDILASGADETTNLTVDLLNDNKVKATTKCLRLLYSEGFQNTRTLQLDSLSELESLKYVDLVGVSSQGRGTGLTRKVSLLKLEGAQRFKLPRFALSLNKMEDLAVLELSHFLIPKEFPEALGNLTNLRILRLSHLKGFDRLPENFGSLCQLRQLELEDLSSLILPQSFGNLVALEHLTFCRIKSLQVPESLGDLSSLVKFRIEDSEELAGLPDSFGRGLISLEELWISGCPFMKRIPESLGEVSSLVTLTIRNCEQLAGLPNSFGRSLEELHIWCCPLIKCLPQCFSQPLSRLKQLSIMDCPRFKELGEAFGSLSSLRQLHLDDVALERLPASFSCLSALEVLLITKAGRLRSLPNDFGRLTALKQLHISAKELETLPESFRFLRSLRKLEIRCPKLKRLPESLGELVLLEELHLLVKRVETLPFSVGKLCSLRELQFDSTVAKLLPESLGQLSTLKILKLQCRHLKKLPDTLGKLSSLEQLSISSSSLESLPDSLRKLSSITRLILSSEHMDKLPDVVVKLYSVEKLSFSLPNLESLPESIGGLRNLRKLTLDIGKKLKRLPDIFGQLISLQVLKISADELQRLPDSFSLLNSLRKLTIKCCKLERLPDDMGKFSSLEEFSVEAASLERLPDSTGQLHNLRKLTLKMAAKLKSLPEDFGQLIALRELSIHADDLQTLPDSFSLLKSLRKLAIKCCKLESLPNNMGNFSSLEEFSVEAASLESLPDSTGKLHNLRRLTLKIAKNLKNLPENFGQLVALQDLRINAEELETLPDSFHQLTSLQRLSIGCPKLERLPDNLEKLSSLEELSISNSSLERLPPSIGWLHSLRRLNLYRVDKVSRLPENIGELTALQELTIGADELETLPDSIYLLKSLQRLTMHCPKLERFPESLGEHAQFKNLRLDVENVGALPEGLGKLSLLRDLAFSSSAAKLLPESLGQLSSLKTLELNCNNLEKLPESFGKLSSLEVLSIKAQRLESLPESIGQLNSLKKLTLAAGKSVLSLLGGIGKLSSLQELEFDCDGHEETPNLFAHISCFANKLILTGRDTRTLPTGLGSLSSLKDLTLSSLRHLEILPDEFGTLSSLESLTIRRCGSLERLPDSLGQASSLKDVILYSCERLKCLPESLGKSSLTQQTLEGEDSSQAEKPEAMRVIVVRCPLLDHLVLKSLGWMSMSNSVWQRSS